MFLIAFLENIIQARALVHWMEDLSLIDGIPISREDRRMTGYQLRIAIIKPIETLLNILNKSQEATLGDLLAVGVVSNAREETLFLQVLLAGEVVWIERLVPVEQLMMIGELPNKGAI